MDDETRRNLAMFRFSIIGPLVACSASQTNFEEKYRELASQTYTTPNGKEITFKAGTIKKWHLDYRKAEAEQVGGGLQALMPKNRIDCGSSRALSEKQQERIKAAYGSFAPAAQGEENFVFPDVRAGDRHDIEAKR